MEFFKNIRLKIGMALLEKKIARTKRKVFYSNFNLVKNIGIVWDASRTDDFAGLSRFYQKMLEKNIDVNMLGYFPGKYLPNQYTAIRYLTCIRKKEINFFYRPVSSETDTFINNRFDILIDLNFKKLFPLQYISSLTNAGFKVGLFDSETMNNPFDLMMEIKNPVDVENYLNQVVHYLEMINSETDKTVNN
ncbi:MAG: hypothetical protein NT144_04180 [Bacteroidia bacterium]|nr:hypothetical protein [Bacteroidia bacterium]